jgi:hypothetical protein
LEDTKRAVEKAWEGLSTSIKELENPFELDTDRWEMFEEARKKILGSRDEGRGDDRG